MDRSLPTPSTLLRGGIMRAAGSEGLKGFVERTPVSRAVVNQYVAGNAIEDAVTSAQQLLKHRCQVTIDYLGEDVLDAETALQHRSTYLQLLERLETEGLSQGGRVEVSLKLSAIGQKLAQDGDAVALENAWAICEKARTAGTTVTIDMEDHTTTDRTLEAVVTLRRDFPWVGAVLQSMLRRTEGDCRDLAGSGSRIRLCKGAYAEPSSVAFADKGEIDRSYARCLKVLLQGHGYPMMATHDGRLVDIAHAIIAATGRSTDSYEFQMLHGVRPKEQRRVAAGAEVMRVYLPFGQEWYGYLMRRMAEKPGNTALFVRSLITKG